MRSMFLHSCYWSRSGWSFLWSMTDQQLSGSRQNDQLTWQIKAVCVSIWTMCWKIALWQWNMASEIGGKPIRTDSSLSKQTSASRFAVILLAFHMEDFRVIILLKKHKDNWRLSSIPHPADLCWPAVHNIVWSDHCYQYLHHYRYHHHHHHLSLGFKGFYFLTRKWRKNHFSGQNI